MWRKISTGISILCLAVYVFAAASATYKIVAAVTEHRIIGEREFAGLQDVARNAGVLGFTGAELENEIRAVVLRSLTLEAVIAAMSDNTSFAVERPEERVIISDYQNSSYSFNTKWKLYRPPYSAQISVDSRTTLDLDVLTGYIDRGRLSDILREMLLVVLLSVTAAFLVLMLDIIVFDKKNAASGTPKKPHDTPGEKPRPEPAASVPAASVPRAETHDAPAENPHGAAPDTPGEEPRPEKPEGQQPAFDENADGPPRMYLGLIQKLREELGSTDEKEEKNPDFVLLCAEWTGENGLAPAIGAKQIAEDAAGFFKVARISAFKKGENGIFILLPDVAFKNGLKAARKFHEHILDNSAFKTAVGSFSIGLTSRAGRQIDPDRLILEAEKALEKAKEDASLPIVAFKANPSKYEDYLKKKNMAANP
jgi:GGDEF domain-containing protein